MVGEYVSLGLKKEGLEAPGGEEGGEREGGTGNPPHHRADAVARGQHQAFADSFGNTQSSRLRFKI